MKRSTVDRSRRLRMAIVDSNHACMAMEEEKSWVSAAAASELLLPKKRKLPRKFRLVEIDEDELKDIFQFLGLGLDAAEEEKLVDVDDDSEEMRELEEEVPNRFRLTDHIEEQQKNVLGCKDPKRRKF